MLWFSLWDAYRYQPISHSVLWFSLWYVYRYQPISHSSCRFSTMYGSLVCVAWSCEKIQALFIFRAICENTAHVQWIMCSPKGLHLIHWTSAVFSHIALKWTQFAYLISSTVLCCYGQAGSSKGLLKKQSDTAFAHVLVCKWRYCLSSFVAHNLFSLGLPSHHSLTSLTQHAKIKVVHFDREQPGAFSI